MATPTDLKAKWLPHSIVVTWGVQLDEEEAPAQELHYRRVEDPEVPWTTFDLAPDVREYDVKGLAADTEYEVMVREVGSHEATIVGKTRPHKS